MTDELFERGDFEHTLKEHADRFFLIPSERVWRSIYNDLHPGSKWPSLAVGLFMFLTLFWVGNTNKEYPNKKVVLPEKTLQQEPAGRQVAAPVISLNRSRFSEVVPEVSRTTVPPVSDGVAGPKAVSDAAGMNAATVTKVISLQDYPGGRVISNHAIPGLSADVIHEPGFEAALRNISFGDIGDAGDLKDVRRNKAGKTGKSNTPAFDRPEEGGRPLIKLRNNFSKKLKWEYFIAPMISSVKFDGVSVSKSNSSVVYTPVSKSNMSIAKRIGFTLGFNTYYPLSHRISLVTGTHFVYTGYNIYSEQLRPNATSLTLVDRNGRMFSRNYISYYGNDKYSSDANIINYNWQLSAPVGMEWEVLPRRNITVSLVSTIEPFIVLGSKAYMLAGDASRYVTDPDLVRKFNLSGNVGSMVSFSGNTVNWKIGPNFRYQILSTYNNVYPVKEHFMSYGVQVGVSKR